MAISKPLLALWAKSGDPYHPLLAHMLDTAAVAVAVLRREPARTRAMYARELGLDETSTVRFIAAVAGAHDLGKATPVFQSQWAEGQRRAEAAGFLFPTAKLPRGLKNTLWVPHAALTEALAEKLLVERGLKQRLAGDIARCLGGHHGFLAHPGELSLTQRSDVTGSGLWDQARRDLLGCLFGAVGAHQAPAAQRLGEPTALGIMSLASFADWIASDAAHFPYGRDAADPEAYWQAALELAEQALNALSWRPRRPLIAEPVPFAMVFPYSANSLQEAVASVVGRAVSDGSDPILLVIEAPMGMGKTEAALYAHLELQRTLGHRGLYVALPTMATGNGTFPRVKEWLQRLARGDGPVDLQLQHGTAFLHPEYQALRPRAIGDLRTNGQGEHHQPDDHGSVIAASWFSPAKRAMLSEYGVGTVDQALLGVLRVRHHFIRLWGLGNRTVILDEVHAYDAYTSGLIAALVGWLKTLGSSVILMSATLPRSRRRELVEAYGGQLPSPEHPYPRLTIVRGGQSESVPVDPGITKTLSPSPAPRPLEQLAPLVLQAVRDGGCAACIVNTVDRAQRLYQALGEGEPIREDGSTIGKRVGLMQVYLLHARYPAEERQKREEVLLRLFGKLGYKERIRPERAVVVATQVIEQSLDLDFDVMFTDLAPLDLVLQRAGRLHRFDLAGLSDQFKMTFQRPAAHVVPRLFVSGLDEDPPDVEAEYWHCVYSPYVLLMSWWVARGRREVRLPGDVEGLIEQVYDCGVPADVPARLRGHFEKACQAFQEEMDKQRAWARHAAITDPSQLLAHMPLDEVGQFRLDDDEDDLLSQVPLTRLGQPSVPVVPVHRVGAGLYLDPAAQTPVPTEGQLTDEMARRLFLCSVRLGRPAVYRALVREQPPAAWQGHPLLRKMRLLELQNGVASKGGVRIRLDPELGVVYLV